MKRSQHTALFDVMIIGAGLAGSSTAYGLAKRGISSCVLESGTTIAPKASGNPLALITPYITDKISSRETLYTNGYAFTLETLLSAPHSLFHQCGALQLPSRRRLQSILEASTTIFGSSHITRVSETDASSISGVAVPSKAFYINDAGYIPPRQFIEKHLLAASQHIATYPGTTVCNLTYEKGQWHAQTENQLTFSAPIVVLSGAYETNSLQQSSWMPLEAIRGQTELLPTTEPLSDLQTALCYGGYITPAHQGYHMIGALYRHHDLSLSPLETDTQSILSEASSTFPSLRLTASNTRSRVCFRTSTPDRIPYIGQVPNITLMAQHASEVRSGSKLRSRVPLVHYPGLYTSVGHGSRGLLSCPIGGEILARLITDEPLEELADIHDIVSPARLPYRLLRTRLKGSTPKQ